MGQGIPGRNDKCRPLPSLLMVGRDLTKVLNERSSAKTETRDYMDQLAALTGFQPSGLSRPSAIKLPTKEHQSGT